MKSQLRAALVVFGSLTVLTGVAYPVIVTGIAQGIFPYRANGSVLMKGAQPVGSEWIGQSFDRANYFWGRPSATGPMPYNSASSSGSNLGPTNSALLESVRDRVKAMREAHPEQTGPVPVDLVTASASGLDPHITAAAAEYQVTRVARARGLTMDTVRQLVSAHTANRTFGILGEPRVNVVQLNLALDALEIQK